MEMPGSVNVTISTAQGVYNGSVQVTNGKFNVTFNVGRLNAGTYNITVAANDVSNGGNYTIKTHVFENNLTVEKRVIEIYDLENITVVYGNNVTVNINGKVNTTRYGLNYTEIMVLFPSMSILVILV